MFEKYALQTCIFSKFFEFAKNLVRYTELPKSNKPKSPINPLIETQVP